MTAPSPEAPEQGEQASVVGGWTKGPWRQDPDFYGDVDAPDGSQIFFVLDEGDVGQKRTLHLTHSTITKEQAIANGRLAAASPQMAEALQAALRARIVRDGDVVDQMRAALLAAGAEVRS